MGPHSERDSLSDLAAPPGMADLDFDLDGDTQIDVFVLSPGAELPFAQDRDAPPPSSRPHVRN